MTVGARRRDRWRQPESVLLVGGAALHGAWEALVTPLYADTGRGWWNVLWTRAHCTAGDVLILLAAHGVTSLAFRDRRWMLSMRPAAAALFVTLGLAYTTWSEWFNTQVAGSWAYADIMPTVLGIGLAPIAQWIILPIVLIVIGRMFLDQDVGLGKLNEFVPSTSSVTPRPEG